MIKCIILFLCIIIVSSCSSLPGRISQKSFDIKNKAAESLKNGNVQYNSGRFSQAMNLFQLSYGYNASVDFEKGIVLSLNSIGKTYLALSEYERALEHFEEAMIIVNTIEDEKLLLLTKGNLADYYIKRGELKRAYQILIEEYLNLKNIKNEESAFISFNLALIYRKKEEFDSAHKHINESLKFHNKEKAYREIAADYYLMATIYSLEENYNEAYIAAEKALEYDKFIEYPQGIAEDLLALSIISAKIGNTTDETYFKKRADSVFKAIGNIYMNKNEESDLESIESQ